MKKTIVYLFLSLVFTSHAQNRSLLDNDLTSEDSTALATIASYPDSLRPAILKACQRPEVLIQTESLQKNTSKSFVDFIDDYSKDEQKKLWDLARYPNLVKEIGSGEKKSKEELEAIVSKYPPDIRETAKEYGRKHHEAVSKMYYMHVSFQAEFEKIIAGYPDETRTAYNILLNHPEILNTLSNNMHLAVILGNMYKSNPEQTIEILNSVNADYQKQTAKNLEDWKNGLEKDPDAKKEMEQAAKEFTQENKNSNFPNDDVYNTASDANYNPNNYNTNVADGNSNPPVMNNNIQPYPYWCGYPTWYDYPYWYPYPNWYYSGVYFGAGGMVYTGVPSPFFMHWYLYHPNHHYYYSHFTDYCIGYHYNHYGPRFGYTGFNREVHTWARVNGNNLPKGFFKPDGNRVDRIKEMGKFEMDYHNSTKGIFGRNISRSEFLQNNSNYYPHMTPAVSQQRYNQTVKYPQQQNPTKFNLGEQRNTVQQRNVPQQRNTPVQRTQPVQRNEPVQSRPSNTNYSRGGGQTQRSGGGGGVRSGGGGGGRSGRR